MTSNGQDVVGAMLGVEKNPLPDVDVLRKNIIDNITVDEIVNDIKYIYSNMYDIYMIYIKSSEEEYIIPYCDSCNCENIKNGQLYKIDDFMTMMDNVFDEAAMKEATDTCQGIIYKSDNDNSIIEKSLHKHLWIYGISFVAWLVVFSVLYKYFERRKQYGE